MKLFKIGKRIIIGITLIGTGIVAAYRIGTYAKDTIYYHNSLYQDVVSDQLAYIADYDDSDVGAENIKDPPDFKAIQNLSSDIQETHNQESENNSQILEKDSEIKEKVEQLFQSESMTLQNEQNTANIPQKVQTQSIQSQPTTQSSVASENNSSHSLNTGFYNSNDNSSLQNLMNEYRLSLGLSELVYDSSLQDYANTRVEEISKVFSHTRPNGEYAVSYKGPYRSEIIANGGSKASRVLSSWKLSDSHNEIIISTNYTRFAVSHYTIKTETGTKNYWVTIFA